DAVLADAGFTLASVPGVTLEGLYEPVTKLAENGRTLLIRCRFMGSEAVQELVGGGGVWDQKAELLRLPVSDILTPNAAGALVPRAGITVSAEALAAAHAEHARTPYPDGLKTAGAALGNAMHPADALAGFQKVRDAYGGPVGELARDGLTLRPYQVVGAYGMAAGHGLMADSPGTGKSLQSIAAAMVTRATRMLVVCPPLVLTHWAREVSRTTFIERALGAVPKPLNKRDLHPGVAAFRAGRKEPALDDRIAVVVVADSMLASRPEARDRIAAWLAAAGARGSFVVDEAHRMKTMGSQRSNAILDLKAAAPEARCYALTGTPILAGPHELVPILEFTGHLTPVFGGAGAFLRTYCTPTRYGGFAPRKRALDDLNRLLTEHVWVRRTKEQVLPQLPARDIVEVALDVSLTEYTRAHRDIEDDIREWVERFTQARNALPNDEEQKEYAKDNLRFVSRLRRAAGIAKVPAAVEMLREHLDGNPGEPVILWAHHVDVVEAMHAAAGEAGVEAGVISGSTSDAQKAALVDMFQAGTLPALVCSITAAGVGITLTRGHEAIFVESDWTPALILQAIDRQHRFGQEHPVTARMLMAVGTLD
ncbi:MAG: hypothetical protein B7X41_21300, partial [Microbacterium sp. 14-71-5]